MKTIVLFVSAYSDEDKGLSAVWKAAKKLFQKGKTKEARQLFRMIRLLAVDYLERLYHDMKPTPNPAIGIYCGILEPSVELTFHFRTSRERTNALPIIKSRMIEFGRRFRQKNVHLADLYAKKPAGIAFGERTGKLKDVTYQKKLWISLLPKAKDAFSNYLAIQELASKAGFENITIHDSAHSLIVYSMGKERATFDEKCTRLVSLLKKHRLFAKANQQGAVALTNYGKGGYMQTHSYGAAERLLKPHTKDVVSLLQKGEG